MIGSIVYLDAFVPENGMSLLDYTTGEGREGGPMVEEGVRTGLVSPIPAEVFGVNRADRDWVDAQCTPHPYGTLTQKIQLTGLAADRIPRKTYILATGYSGLAFSGFAAHLKQDPAWRYHEVDCGHDVMIDAPGRLAEILEDAA